jgi:hypothetical protein
VCERHGCIISGDVRVYVYTATASEAAAYRRLLATLGGPTSPYRALNATARYAAYSVVGGAIEEVILAFEQCKSLIRIDLTGTSDPGAAGNYARRPGARLRTLVC